MLKKLAGLTAIAGLFIAGTASAQITGTDHDMRTRLTIDEICVVCHAPHNNQNVSGDLLWNHDPSTQTFDPYTSLTLDGASAGPGAVSLLCLGCHDGVVSVDAYGGGADGANPITGNAAFGSDLSNDHPVGITYDDSPATGDTELKATTTPVTYGNASAGTVADMLQGGAVECGSCHDVHNTLSAGNTALLAVDNTGSALCFACHNK